MMTATWRRAFAGYALKKQLSTCVGASSEKDKCKALNHRWRAAERTYWRRDLRLSGLAQLQEPFMQIRHTTSGPLHQET